MARPKKDPELVKSVDLRIPVTVSQKLSITAASTAAGEDFAAWAREILLGAAEAQAAADAHAKRAPAKRGRKK